MLLGPGFYIISKNVSIENITFLGAGLGAMTIARSPNGIVGQISGAFDRFRKQPAREDDVADVELTQEVESIVAPVG